MHSTNKISLRPRVKTKAKYMATQLDLLTLQRTVKDNCIMFHGFLLRLVPLKVSTSCPLWEFFLATVECKSGFFFVFF